MEQNLGHAERNFRDIYEDNYQLMTVMLENKIPVPQVYSDATEHVLNRDLQNFFLNGTMYLRELERLSREFRKWKVDFKNVPAFKLNASQRINMEVQWLEQSEGGLERLKSLNKILNILDKMEVILDFAKCQNSYFKMAKKFRKGELSFESEEWKVAFLELGEILKVRARV